MPNDDLDQIRADLAEALRIEGLRLLPEDPPARTMAHTLGYVFRPGDLVVDTVTGQQGTVIHATETHIVAAGR